MQLVVPPRLTHKDARPGVLFIGSRPVEADGVSLECIHDPFPPGGESGLVGHAVWAAIYFTRADVLNMASLGGVEGIATC